MLRSTAQSRSGTSNRVDWICPGALTILARALTWKGEVFAREAIALGSRYVTATRKPLPNYSPEGRSDSWPRLVLPASAGIEV